MSKIIFGAVAVIASLGAAQLAVGHDLNRSTEKVVSAAGSDHVNRSAKADRASGIAPVAGKTIVTRMSALDDTSVIIRVPRAPLIRESLSGANAKRPVACEAPASVLTEISKRLESGRCVT